MPDKLTDNEIIKALECCIDNTDKTCSECAYSNCDCNCVDELQKNALDLINRLQAENERLKEEKAKIENKIEEIYPLVMKLPKVMQTAKAEAYKEFAELVNKEAENVLIDREGDFLFSDSDKIGFEIYDTVAEWCKAITDNFLKELVGEDNPKNNVKCIECEYLEFKTPYGVCGKAYKGIVSPNDSCGKGKLEKGDKK